MLIHNLLEDSPNYEEVIPLVQYSSKTLAKVLEFCEKAEYENKDLVKKPILDVDE